LHKHIFLPPSHEKCPLKWGRGQNISIQFSVGPAYKVSQSSVLWLAKVVDAILNNFLNMSKNLSHGYKLGVLKIKSKYILICKK
jgi:hypothetical protein